MQIWAVSTHQFLCPISPYLLIFWSLQPWAGEHWRDKDLEDETLEAKHRDAPEKPHSELRRSNLYFWGASTYPRFRFTQYKACIMLDLNLIRNVMMMLFFNAYHVGRKQYWNYAHVEKSRAGFLACHPSFIHFIRLWLMILATKRWYIVWYIVWYMIHMLYIIQPCAIYLQG